MPDAINTLPVALRRIPLTEVNATSKTRCLVSGQSAIDLTASNVKQEAAGPFGTCLAFDGSRSTIDLPADAALLRNIVKHDFAISVWVKITNYATEAVIFDATQDANNFVQMRVLSTGKVCLYYRYDGGQVTYTRTQVALKTNTWYHITAVNNYADGAPETIYINGQLALWEANTLISSTYAGTNGKIAIGSRSNLQNYYQGSLASFRLYDRTLDIAQVRAIMAQDQTGLCTKLGLDEGPADGTITVSGATAAADDLLGAGLKFDGTDDYASIALPSAVSSPSTQDFTVTLWVRGADLNAKSTYTCLLDATKDTNNYVQLYIPSSAGSKLEFAVKSPSGTYKKLSETLQKDRWYHVAVVWNSITSTAQLYVDGQEATGTGVGSPSNGTAGSFNLGRRSSGNGYFNGSMAHLRVYDKALAGDAIRKIRNQDQIATATFRTEYPLSFTLVDDSAYNALYIANDGITNKFVLEITNDCNQVIALQPFRFAAGTRASSTNHHFELQFKAQTFEKGSSTIWSYLNAVLSDPNWVDWSASAATVSAGDGKISVYLAYVGANPLQLSPGQIRSFPFEYQSAGVNGGARGTTIQLRCANLYLGLNATPLGYSRIQSADIINRRGERQVPLRVGIVSSNTILNDASSAAAGSGTANTVTIRVANTLESVPGYPERNRLPFKRNPDPKSDAVQYARGTDITQFTLVFEDPVGKEWDLATTAQLNAVVLSVNEAEWGSTPNIKAEVQGKNIVFKFTPKMPYLGPEKWIDLTLTNLRTNIRSGLANIVLKYEDLPGYQDGHFVVQVEKTPLVIRDTVDSNGNKIASKVGIGTAAPVYELDVRGTVGINDYVKHNGDDGTRIGFPANQQISMSTNGAERLRIIADGKVGIGTTNPTVPLHVTGGSWPQVGIANSGMVILGDAASTHLGMSANVIQAKSSTTTANTLYLNYGGGDVGVGPNCTLSSTGQMTLTSDGTTAASIDLRAKGDARSEILFGSNNNSKFAISSRASGDGNDLYIMRKDYWGWSTLMTFDYANSYVGIGTTKPAVPLNITGGSWAQAGTANTGVLILGEATSTHLAMSADTIQAKGSGRSAGTLYLNYGGGSVYAGGDISISSYLRNNANTSTYIGFPSANTIQMSTWGNVRLTIADNGAIGIGGSPTTGMACLQIYAWQNRAEKRYHYSGGSSFWDTGSQSYSIWTQQAIAAWKFCATSDARIKDIEGVSEAEKDLEILKRIEITNYTYKDRVADGGRPHKKVIGQQIAKVFPQAISTHAGVVPDILQSAKLEGGHVSLPGVDIAKGDKLRLIFSEKNGTELLEVQESDAGRIKLDTDRSGEVFVYGREVPDFHEVDYDALSMLNISATQALVRQVETLQRENQYLQSATREMRLDLDRVLAQLNAKTRKS